MTAVGQVSDRKDRPAYVRFQRRAVQNHQASLAAGKYVGNNVDYALITPPYSKDVVELKVETWFKNMIEDVRNDRLPQSWADQYREMYDKWKVGEEMPLRGTAIRGWGVLSPAQQETLISMNVLTVEDLAGINDEGCRRIGMGAMDLKNKAVAWLAQLNDLGPLTFKVAALEQTIKNKDGEISALTQKVTTLQQDLRSSQLRVDMTPPAPEASISAVDILPEATI